MQKRAHFSEGVDWVSEMIQEDAQRCLELDEKIKALRAKIKEIAKDSKMAKILLSIPGFGTICTAELAGEIGTVYFNRKHRKIGHLFQGRYKAIVCDKDQCLLSLVRYIHLNPLRAKMVQKIKEYPYSGHRDYMGGRVSEVLTSDRVLEMVGGGAGYQRFVQDGLKDGHREDYYQAGEQRFLGAEGFAEKLKRKGNEEEIPRRKKPLSVAFRPAARAAEVEPEVLGGADRGWKISQLRALVGYVLIRRLGYKLKEVARCLGRDAATVSSLVSRIADRMGGEEALRKRAKRLAADCQE